MRELPVLAPLPVRPLRPLSFVVVRFSDEYLHNIARSECVRDPRNQLVTLDNVANLNFDNLMQAINAGIANAVHDLVALVHEDVYLLPQWQAHLTLSLHNLERHDPDWGLAGSVGRDAPGKSIGHWSDPHRYRDTLGLDSFREVASLDEQIVILRRVSDLRFDDRLPSIHNIGKDISLTAKALSMKTYVVNAPTIHKYADADGNLIQNRDDSPKIKNRVTFTYRADKRSSDEYFHHKWPDSQPTEAPSYRYDLSEFPTSVVEALDSPVILISRGGSGSRLLADLALDLGLFIGNEVNRSGDCIDLVIPVYQGVIDKFRFRAQWQKELIVPRLRACAASMLNKAGTQSPWGFKLPESILLLPELHEAFPNARYLHLIRDPLTTCLRRTHMTARLDNEIGRVTLPAAYTHCGISTRRILTDSPAMHMALTTIHQLEQALDHGAMLPAHRYLETRFEHLLSRPGNVLDAACQWSGLTSIASQLAASIDARRANNPRATYSETVTQQLTEVLTPLRRRLGYAAQDSDVRV